jgi:hypothetical protein
MSLRSKLPQAPVKPAPLPDDPIQSDLFIAKAREIEADARPEIFERAFRKVAFSRIAHRQPKAKRSRKGT